MESTNLPTTSRAALYGVSLLATAAASLLPISQGGSYSGLVSAGGKVVVALLLIAICQLLAATGGSASPHLEGLGAGAGAASVGLFGAFAAIIAIVIPSHYWGPGVYAMMFAAGIGFVSFVAGSGIRHRTGPINSAVATIGVLSALTLGVGSILVPTDYHLSLAEWNGFGHGADVKYALAAQAFIWIPVLGAVIGFSTKTRWGAYCSLAALLPFVWFVISAMAHAFDKDGGGTFSGAIRVRLHPLAMVGAIGVGLAIVLCLAGSSASAHNPVGMAQSMPGAAPNLPTAQWAPDPFGRFQSRYWDGAIWTDTVANGGVMSKDPEAPNPTPPVPSRDLPAPVVTSSPGGAFAAPQALVAASVPDHDGMTVRRPSIDEDVRRSQLRFNGGATVTLETPIAIGRDPMPAVGQRRFVIDDSSVSKTHLVASMDNGHLWVEDRHSTNGVDLCELGATPVRLQPGERRQVGVGATVRFGDAWFTYERET